MFTQLSILVATLTEATSTPGTQEMIILLLGALTGTSFLISRKQTRKARRKLLLESFKNLFRKKGDGKGLGKVAIIIMLILLGAMMIYFLKWIGIIVVLLCLIPFLIIKKR